MLLNRQLTIAQLVAIRTGADIPTCMHLLVKKTARKHHKRRLGKKAMATASQPRSNDLETLMQDLEE